MRPVRNEDVVLIPRALPNHTYLRTWTYTAGRGTRQFQIELDASDDCAALIEIELMLVRRFLETRDPATALVPGRSALGILAWHVIRKLRFGVVEVAGDIAPVDATLEKVASRHGASTEASARLIGAFDAYRERAIEQPRELPADSALRVRKEYKVKLSDRMQLLASRILHS